MPSLGTLLRGAMSRKNSNPETSSASSSSTTARRQSSAVPPHVRMQRTQSIASMTSLSIFRKKDKEWENLYDNVSANSTVQPHSDDLDDKERRELAVHSPAPRRSRYAIDPQTMLNSRSRSATNGLAALRINTPNTIRPSIDGN